MRKEDALLKKIERIKEVTFKISSNRKLFKKLFGKRYFNSDDGAYAYAVYINDSDLIVGYQFQNKKALGREFKKELADFVRFYKPTEYKDYLFFLGAYPRSGIQFPCIKSGQPTMKKLLSLRYVKHDLIDSVLSESHGFLIWDYQLYNLIKYFQNDKWEKIKQKVVDNYNKDFENNDSKKEPLGGGDKGTILWLLHGYSFKKQYFCDLLKSMRFDKNLDMYDVLKERMVTGKVYAPNILEAYKLYKFMR